MGTCMGKPIDDTTKQIESRLRDLYQQQQTSYKILMLGSGESGKSTFVKQLGWLYGRNINDKKISNEQKKSSILRIRSNIIEAMLILLFQTEKLSKNNKYKNISLYININLNKNKYINDKIKYIVSFNSKYNKSNDDINKVGLYVKELWGLEQIQNAYKLRSYFSFSDNLDYFINKADKVFTNEYIPDKQDILKLRQRTTGLINVKIDVCQNNSSSTGVNSFEIIDVGGQRCERTKWIDNFNGISAVLFVAALNHYDSVIFEDESQNGMHESLAVFDKYVNMDNFNNTEIILFLNKDDIFRKKLKQGIHLTNCFKNHPKWKPKKGIEFATWNDDDHNYNPNKYPKGSEEDEKYFDSCYEAAVSFISNEYEKRFFKTRDKKENIALYSHVTVATSEKNVETIFWDVQSQIVRKYFTNIGFS